MCRLLPAWLSALRDRGVRVVALFVARDPVEVAASIEARNSWAPPLGELLWLRYTCDAEAATRGIARTAIAYDALLADPAGTLHAALAVSYTHLDVYKRQPRARPDRRQPQPRQAHRVPAADIAAVSYTHLDVYKRQVACRSCLPRA